MAFAASTAMLVTISCSLNKEHAQVSDVHTWGSQTVASLAEIYPDSFQAMTEGAIIPNDFDYAKLSLDYDKSSNIDAELSLTEKSFLRDAGVISSIAEFCGMEWNNKNFDPIMAWHRRNLSPLERRGYKIAKTGVTHGFAQGRMDWWLKTNDPHCLKVRSILDGNLFADNFKGYAK